MGALKTPKKVIKMLISTLVLTLLKHKIRIKIAMIRQYNYSMQHHGCINSRSGLNLDLIIFISSLHL